MLSEGEAERLRTAAEEVAWLCGRGYVPAAAASFVAEQRLLTVRERSILDASARADAHHRHHIARELDAEDVAKKPLRVDVSSLVDTVAAAIAASEGAAILLFESTAGIVFAPGLASSTVTPHVAGAVERIARAVIGLRPSAVRIVYENTNAGRADALARALKKRPSLSLTSDEVSSVPARLNEAVFVASAAPEVLDRCGTWINLAAPLVRELGVIPLRIG
jgi:hypothetical protein